MTNSEYLRQMSDEELANTVGFLFCQNNSVECPYFKAQPLNHDGMFRESCSDLCRKAFIQWLKQDHTEKRGKINSV